MSRASIKVGNRYGSTELISINAGRLTLVCDCSNVFEQAVTVADRQGVSRCCKDCYKLIASRAIRPDKKSVSRREYTVEEEQMIKDFDNDRAK